MPAQAAALRRERRAPPPAQPQVPLRLLRIAAAVAQHGSASHAAAALHLSASAVARAVQQAEERLGLPLFERGARGMSLTPAGALLVPRVRRAFELLRSAGGAKLAQRVTEGMLEALEAVAASGSETAAAQRLDLSQGAVHVRLRMLEHSARAAILARTRRGTRLRPAGEQLLRNARLAANELRIAYEELGGLLGRSHGFVAVGALPMAADALVPQAIAGLAAVQPRTRVKVVDGTYEALLAQLRQGEVDFVVGPLREATAPPDVVEHTLFTEPLLPVVRSGHPVLRSGKRSSLRALLAWPWIGPLPDTPAHLAFERAFRHARVPVPEIAVQANSPAAVRGVLASSDSVAMLSPLQIRSELGAGVLALVPCAVHGTERVIGTMRRADGRPSPAALALHEQLQRAADALVRSSTKRKAGTSASAGRRRTA
jgi:LysR family transcriptional regulator, regulator for genes of the gallate degradation pathway